MSNAVSVGSVSLQTRVTCPHCWAKFAPEEALTVSQHPDLAGDARLGADHQQRFLATRFSLSGAAIDSRGFECHHLACPKCHLQVPRALFELEAMFLSILGAPSCGKSYLLASMAWQLRKTLPRQFSLAFTDADPTLNRHLNEYEELQFLNPNQDKLVVLRKTEEQGDLYNTVLYGENRVRYPAPFVFVLKPLENHPNVALSNRISRAICLYDNAGESFLPGSDQATAPVTRHLALSRALFFCFDPTQELRFRNACMGKSADPQMKERSERLARERPVRQDTILLEAADRVRRYAGIAQNAKHNRPLVVVVTKYDAWSALLGNEPLTPPWVPTPMNSLHALDLDQVEARSRRVRNLLWELCPEIVSAAEGFSDQVIFIPVSAIGRPPEVDPQTKALGIRPRDMQPQWAEVPLLYVMARWFQGIVPYFRSKEGAADTIPFPGATPGVTRLAAGGEAGAGPSLGEASPLMPPGRKRS